MLLSRIRPILILILFLVIVSVSAARSGIVGATPSTTHAGRSLSLDHPSGGFVRVPDHPALNPADAITIEAWVWRDNAARCETVLGKNYFESYWLGFCNGPIRFYTAGLDTWVDGNIPIPARTWTHVAVTYDGTTRRYYVNGQLDLETTAANGPLADNDSDLGIGFDPETTFTNNNFDGFIDEVRLWSRVRTQSEIQAAMREELFGSDPGLIANWRFNESASDFSAAGHADDGTLEGNATFTPRGVLPRSTGIYHSDAAVSVDGQCNPTEYNLASLQQSGFATVYMQHDDENAYICFAGLERGTGYAAHVLLDTDFSQDDPPTSDDYRFTIDMDGNNLAEQGDGFDGFNTFTPAAGTWEAERFVDFEFTWSAEFRFSRGLLQVPEGRSDSFGLGLVEDRASNPDFSWPGALVETQPSTWGAAFASAYGGTTQTYDFDGYVLDEGTGEGITGSTIQFFASTPAGIFLLNTAATDSDGYYTFSYTAHVPATFLVQQVDKTGYSSVSATVGDDGRMITPNAIRYDSFDEDHVYTTATFLDATGRPPPRAFNRHYLIVYGSPVIYSDLWPLIEMKRLQGFNVLAETVQNIEAGTTGADRAEKIRNWLRAQWQNHDPDDVYALLLGDSDVIPERQVGWEGDTAHRDPDVKPAYATDWYYADLDSDAWDADGDGYYGEYLYCGPGRLEVPIPGSDEKGPCPYEGSHLREGAYGTEPGNHDDWTAEISIGRIMLNDRAEVRRALETIAHTEASGDLAKRSALLAGAMWGYYGNSWDADNSRYKIGEGPDLRGPWPEDGNPPFGDDSATQLETLVRPEINPYMAHIFTLYEGISPDDDPALIPTAQTFDLALQRTNVTDTLTTQDYGLVNVIGHGDEFGVYHSSWLKDHNGNGRIENPVDPTQAEDCTTNCREVSGYRPFIRFLDTPAPTTIAPVYVANACSTGDWIAGRNSVASRLLAGEKAAAWMGALSIVPVHSVDGFQRDFNRDIVRGSRLLGDAAWGTNGRRYRIASLYDWRHGTLQLFGDPAYSYWGNPADALAGWPQLGNDWWASGYTLNDGPASGGWVWIADDYAPQSPPVVDRDGHALVGAESRLVKYDSQGVPVDSAVPGVTVDYAPAVTTDGVYVASGGTLYNYDQDLNLREQISLGGLATGAPRVGADGTVWVPTTLGMARITGAGLPVIASAAGPATSPVSFVTSRGAVWTTENGLYGLFGSRTGQSVGVEYEIPGVELTPPSAGKDQGVFVGGDNGRLYAFTSLVDPPRWTFDADGAISGRPAVGPDGTVYIGTTTGRVYAVRDGNVVWQHHLGTAISAALALDSNRLYVTAGSTLQALSLGSGASLWSIDLGGPTDGRSTPVIANHSLYVTRADGNLAIVISRYLLTVPTSVLAEPLSGVPGNIEVSWQDNNDSEIGFSVEVCEIDGSCAPWLTVPADTTEVTLSQLTPSTTIYVRVQALGGYGGASPTAPTAEYHSDYGYSDPVIALPDTPESPTGLTATAVSAGEIELAWSYGGSDVNILSGFNVYRSDGAGGPYTLVGHSGASTMSFNDRELAPGTTYHYRVTAVNDGGESSSSNIADSSTKGLTLAAPTGLTAVQEPDNSVSLTWLDNAENETGYAVLQKLDGVGSFGLIATLPADATTYDVPYYLVSYGRVEYQVKAVNETAESAPATGVLDYAVLSQHELFLPLAFRP